MRTAIGQVRSLGSTREGAGHFKAQRLTGIANLLLVLWFVAQAVGMSGATHAEWAEWFGSTYHATLMILLVVSSFYHARLGVQVVIEDYVHSEPLKLSSLAALTLVTILLATACIVSILKLAIGA